MIVIPASRHNRPNVRIKLSEIAEQNGWDKIITMSDRQRPRFKKGDVTIDVCDTCGGGFVRIEGTAAFLRGTQAIKYLKGE